MSVKDFIINFWRNVAEQNAQKLGMFFSHDAEIKWHCTNERFNVKEFVKVNCEYPGKWNAEIERLEQCDKTVVSVVRVWNETSSFHVTSFFNIENGLIKVLEEYWGDDGIAPKWRISMKIGSAINKPINKSITIKPLDNMDFDVIYKGFALAFADYEFQVSYDSLRAMLKRRGFNPSLSFAAFNGNEIVSFVLNGTGDFNGIFTAYDTGTGTAKEYRGRGLAAEVFKFSIPYLKNAGIKQYLLEVLQHNDKAISLYQKQGFEVVRELDYFFQQKDKITVSPNFCSSFSIKEIAINDNNQISTFWDFVPSWQNSLDSVKRAGDGFVSLGAYDKENLIGYCIFETCSGDITQLAVKREYRRKGTATLLLNEILKRTKADKIGIVNTDSACGSINFFLKSKNIHLSGKQYEMIKKL